MDTQGGSLLVAFHGLRWWQFDLAGYVIRLLERLGLAHDVDRGAPAALAARQARRAETASMMGRDVERETSPSAVVE